MKKTLISIVSFLSLSVCFAQTAEIEKAALPALELLAIGDQVAGVATLGNAIEKYPDSVFLYVVRGATIKAKDNAAAQKDFEKALALPASDIFSLSSKATANMLLGDNAAAQKILRQIVGMDAKNAYDMMSRASAHKTLGDFEAALADAEKAYKAAPDSLMVLATRVIALADAGKKEESISAAQKMTEIFPDSAIALTSYGMMEFQSENYAKAAEIFGNIVKKYPKAENMARMASVAKAMAAQRE